MLASQMTHQTFREVTQFLKRHQALLGLVAAVACMTLVLPIDRADAFGPCCCFCDEGFCRVNIERQEEDVPVFRVEQETICIPPLRFPWERGPIRKCGKVRQVNKLVIESRSVPACLYEWKAIHCCKRCRERLRHRHSLAGNRNDNGDGARSDTSLDESHEAAPAESISTAPLALVTALLHQQPDEHGWVHLSNRAAEPLTAVDDEFIDPASLTEPSDVVPPADATVAGRP